MNIANIIGRATRDAEIRHTGTGTAVASFTLAVGRVPKKGQTREEAGTDFIRCTAWGKTAESVGQNVTKGRLLAVSGQLRSSKRDIDGHSIETVEIWVDRWEALERRTETADATPRPAPKPKPPVQQTIDGFMDIPDGIDEELPFE